MRCDVGFHSGEGQEGNIMHVLALKWRNNYTLRQHQNREENKSKNNWKQSQRENLLQDAENLEDLEQLIMEMNVSPKSTGTVIEGAEILQGSCSVLIGLTSTLNLDDPRQLKSEVFQKLLLELIKSCQTKSSPSRTNFCFEMRRSQRSILSSALSGT